MKDYEVVDLLMDEINVNSNYPEIIKNHGFTPDGISDVFLTQNTPSFVSGTCTIETTQNMPFYGEFEITINENEKNVEFIDFDVE